MKCIAIDDEPKALDIIELYVNKIPFLEFSGRFVDALKALENLQNIKPDLIFLDINMPDISGIDFLKTLSYKPMVIFTTAYTEYAIESYEYQAVDYLVKPILFNRFLKAANHANKIFELNNLKQNPTTEVNVTQKKDHMFLKDGKEYYKVLFSEIILIEGARNYLTFYTIDRKVMCLMTMKELETILPSSEFARIHKSIIVSLSKIQKIKDNHIFINDSKFSIGAIFKSAFFNKIENL